MLNFKQRFFILTNTGALLRRVSARIRQYVNIMTILHENPVFTRSNADPLLVKDVLQFERVNFTEHVVSLQRGVGQRVGGL